jgi:hypothetical protein
MLPQPPKDKEIIGSSSSKIFSAIMQALVELLTKVDSLHWTFLPKITEVDMEVPTFLSLTVISKTLLDSAPAISFNVAVAMYA